MINPDLSPNNTPAATGVKRFNRLPALIVFFLLLAVLTVFAFIIIESGHRQKTREAGTRVSNFDVNQKGASYIVAGKQEHGVIPPASSPDQPQDPVTSSQTKSGQDPTEQTEPPPPQQISRPEQPSVFEKELEKIQQTKLKRLQLALTSPAAVQGGTTPHQNTQSTTRDKSYNPPQQNTNTIQNRSNMSRLEQLLTEATDDSNNQKGKKAFYEQDQAATEYLQHIRTAPISPLEIKTGTIIPAVMVTGLNSDLPGIIKAQVSQNVYDTATGQYLLIPQGSQLIGTYDNAISYGQDRALVAWSRLVFPDASTLELKGMPGTDQQGYAGLHDKVDNHYFRIFGSAILISAITGAYEYVQDDDNHSYYGNDNESVGDVMAKSVARELAAASSALLQKNLNIQPTIEIRPGYLLNVMVNKDIVFPTPWE